MIWCAAVHGVTKSWTWLSSWTELDWTELNGSSLFNFLRYCFSTVAHKFTSPLTVYKGSFFSVSLPALIISYLFDNSHSNRYKLISHCGFDLHFPNNYWCWTSFHLPLDHLWKNVYPTPRYIFKLGSVFFVFFLLLLSCMLLPLSHFSVSNSVRPHRRQPRRCLCPWDSPGKNTGVGCHFLLQCMHAC